MARKVCKYRLAVVEEDVQSSVENGKWKTFYGILNIREFHRQRGTQIPARLSW